MVVVDGNHEMWPCLINFLNRHDTLAQMQRRRPLHLAGSLWWADRGSVWTWSGRRFGALGGSVSPDRWVPSVARYRWPEEAITQDDLERLIDNAPDGLDVLIGFGVTLGLLTALPAVRSTQRTDRAMDDLLRQYRSLGPTTFVLAPTGLTAAVLAAALATAP